MDVSEAASGHDVPEVVVAVFISDGALGMTSQTDIILSNSYKKFYTQPNIYIQIWKYGFKTFSISLM